MASCALFPPPPQLLHSQETDYQATHLAAEPSTKLLFTASQDTRPGQTAEYVTVHSLDPDSGMLAFKYRWAWVKRVCRKSRVTSTSWCTACALSLACLRLLVGGFDDG